MHELNTLELITFLNVAVTIGRWWSCCSCGVGILIAQGMQGKVNTSLVLLCCRASNSISSSLKLRFAQRAQCPRLNGGFPAGGDAEHLNLAIGASVRSLFNVQWLCDRGLGQVLDRLGRSVDVQLAQAQASSAGMPRSASQPWRMQQEGLGFRL